jgi:hypothetical protein
MENLLPKKAILLFILPLLIVLFVGSNMKVSAFDLFNKACTPSTTTSSEVCKAKEDAKNANSSNNVVLHTISVISNILALLAGFLAVVMIIVSGFMYVTSAGNAEETKKARNRIIYAAVGLAIIAFAWTITRFVLDEVL